MLSCEGENERSFAFFRRVGVRTYHFAMTIPAKSRLNATAPAAGKAMLLPIAARRHRFVAEVARRLRGRCGVELGSRLVVGVSGGPDSVALLAACHVLAHRRSEGQRVLQPIVVHVNHHLRASADDDASFVVDLCDQLELEHHLKDVHPANVSGNVAANARRLRYAALAEVARDVNAAYVAVAHHGDDQLETLLIALCRGAGLDGLSGMAWQRPLGGDLTLVRPLLGLRKVNCEAYCQMAQLKWRDDPTNTDISQVRGRLRRDVIPVLEQLWPEVGRRATGAAEALAMARDALEAQLAGSFGPPTTRAWDRTALAELPVPIIAAGLRRAALNAAPEIADTLGQTLLYQAAEAITADDRSPKQFHWPGGLLVYLTARSVELRFSAWDGHRAESDPPE